MKLHKSLHNRVLFGVCGGIAETLGVSAHLVRGLFVLCKLLLPRVPVLLLYLLLGFFLPYGSGEGTGSAGGQGRPFGGAGRPYGGQRPKKEYKPEAPPFDTTNAQDVEVDCRHGGKDYSEEDYFKASRQMKDADYDR